MVANPRKAARNRLRRRHDAGAMRGNNRGDRFSHARPRSETSLIGGCGKARLSNTKWKRPRYAMLAALRRRKNPCSIEASGVPLCTPELRDRILQINSHYQVLE
jgi:hypothetical protein